MTYGVCVSISALHCTELHCSGGGSRGGSIIHGATPSNISICGFPPGQAGLTQLLLWPQVLPQQEYRTRLLLAAGNHRTRLLLALTVSLKVSGVS